MTGSLTFLHTSIARADGDDSVSGTDWSVAACSQTISVSGTNDAQALQMAINAASTDASAPTVVCLADGQFNFSNIVIDGRHVVLRNVDAASAVKVIGAKDNPAFIVRNGGSLSVDTVAQAGGDRNANFLYGNTSAYRDRGSFAQVDGSSALVFNHGTISHIGGNSYGALVRNNGGRVTVNGGSFSNNFTSKDGGAVIDSRGGSVAVNGGSFSNNGEDASHRSSNGGVAYLVGASMTIKNGSFTGNSAQRHGGVLFAKENSTVTVNGGIFEANTVDPSKPALKIGGGVIYASGAESHVTITGGTFRNNAVNMKMDWNTRYSGGGAIWAQGDIDISGGTFSQNTVGTTSQTYPGQWAGGGAIFVYGADAGVNRRISSLNISGSPSFNDNTSYGDGGAIFLGWSSEAILQGGTFTDNASHRLGGAIYTEDETTTYMADSYATRNKAGHFGGGLWLCPSGRGYTSKGASMIAVDNTADKRYDGFAASGANNTATGAAGDDFALMSPTKKGIHNSYQLSDRGWKNYANQAVMDWWQDGTLTEYTDGLDLNSQAAGGGGQGLSVAAGSKRYDAASSNNVLVTDRVFTSTNEDGKPKGVGVALKATLKDGVAKDYYNEYADVKFTSNTAWYSGGGFGTNGVLIFDVPYRASWHKRDADTEDSLKGSKWKLSIKGSDIVKTSEAGRSTPWFSGIFGLGQCSVQQTEECWKQTAGADTTGVADDVWEAVVADQGSADQDTREGMISVSNLAVGKFTVQEIQAPDGYYLSDKTYTFTTTESGNLPSFTVDGKAIGTDDDNIPAIGDQRITVRWTKTDSDNSGLLLAGSEWKLEKKSTDGNSWEYTATITDCTPGNLDTNGKCPTNNGPSVSDEDDAAGKFSISGLKPGSYRLTETKAPQGYYSNSKQSYTFDIPDSANAKPAEYDKDGSLVAGSPSVKVTDGKYYIQLSANGRVVANNAIGNTRTKVTWSKATKDDTSKLLGGSKWKIYQKNSKSDAYQPMHYTAATPTALSSWTVASDDANATEIADCTAADQCTSADQDAAEGRFLVENLPAGTYKLVETQAPDGYFLPDGDKVFYTFTISESSNDPANVFVSLVGSDTTAKKLLQVEKADKHNVIVNVTKTTALPQTGGLTSLDFLIVSFAGFAVAAVAAIIAQRRRRTI